MRYCFLKSKCLICTGVDLQKLGCSGWGRQGCHPRLTRGAALAPCSEDSKARSPLQQFQLGDVRQGQPAV